MNARKNKTHFENLGTAYNLKVDNVYYLNTQDSAKSVKPSTTTLYMVEFSHDSVLLRGLVDYVVINNLTAKKKKNSISNTVNEYDKLITSLKKKNKGE